MSISAGASSLKEPLTEDIIRHIFLNNISGLRKRYAKEFGDEMILACDGKGYWRKSFFPYYKFKRSENRAKSSLDWSLVFSCMDKIYNEIDENFPYKVVRVDGCEGDDVIAVLVKYFNETRFCDNDTTSNKENEYSLINALSLDEESRKTPEPILIISADKDFLQLQTYPQVKQYSPVNKGYIREADAVEARYEKIIKGDAGDGVMNIWSPDDCFVTGKRQVPATAKKIQPLLESLKLSGKLPDDLDSNIKRNFERNTKLIDLVNLQLPKGKEAEIIATYEEANVAPKSKLHSYFIKHQLRNLLGQIQNF